MGGMKSSRAKTLRRLIAAVLVLVGAVLFFTPPYGRFVKAHPEVTLAAGVALMGGGAALAIPGTSVWSALIAGAISPFAAFVIFEVLFWSGVVFVALFRLLFPR